MSPPPQQPPAQPFPLYPQPGPAYAPSTLQLQPQLPQLQSAPPDGAKPPKTKRLAGSPSALRHSSGWPLVARSGASTVVRARPRQLQRQRSQPPRPLRLHRRPLRLRAPARLRHPRRPPSRSLIRSSSQNRPSRSRSGMGQGLEEARQLHRREVHHLRPGHPVRLSYR